jgi:hypothetical protein
VSKPLREVYQHYYDLIAANPGLTLAEYAKMTPCGSHYYSQLKDIITWMEYYGYLLYEGLSGDLWPYKVVERYPEDLHVDPIGHDCRWRRTGTTITWEGWKPDGRLPRWMKRHDR